MHDLLIPDEDALARRREYDKLYGGPAWSGGSQALTIKRNIYAGSANPYIRVSARPQLSESERIARFRRMLDSYKWELAANSEKGMCIGTGRLDKQVKPGLGWAARPINLSGKRRTRQEKRRK